MLIKIIRTTIVQPLMADSLWVKLSNLERWLLVFHTCYMGTGWAWVFPLGIVGKEPRLCSSLVATHLNMYNGNGYALNEILYAINA